MAEDSSDIAIINASLHGHKRPEDLAHVLEQLAGEAHKSSVIQRLFRSMSDIVTSDNLQASHLGYYLHLMALEGYAPDPEAAGFMMGLDDEFYLAEVCASNNDAIVKELTTFLRHYASRN